MSKIQISLIVPIYNSERYLQNCIESVLGQVYDNWELLLVDDGSTDSSGQICDEYAALDTRIRVFHLENAGAAQARNYGMEVSTGYYIAFLDSDDYLEPEYLSVLMEHMKEHDMCCCGFLTESEEKARSADGHRGVSRVLSAKESFREIFTGGVSTYPWNKLYRRALIEEHNLRFDTQTYYCEDAQFVAEYCQYVHSVMVISCPLYHYVIHPTSIVHSAFSEKKLGFLHGFERMREIAQQFQLESLVDVEACINAQHLIYQLYVARDLSNPAVLVLKKALQERRKALWTHKGLVKQRFLCLVMSFSVHWGCWMVYLYKKAHK